MASLASRIASRSRSHAARAALNAFNLQTTRNVTYMPKPGEGATRTVTLLPGDGAGPLCTNAVEQVFKAIHAPVVFETYDLKGTMPTVPTEVLDSLRRNKVGIKGGVRTAVAGGVSSLTVQLRKEFDLFAHLAYCSNFPGLKTRHDNVNIVVIRENTEGEYSGLEHEVTPGVVESLKVITKFCSERIAKYAFEYAYLNNRKTVTAVHKANIMKLADGQFLESCREVSKQYPQINYNEVIIDNCCMQLVSKPEQFDVMVTPNLYGTLISNCAAGIAGGTTVMPGGNVGYEHAIFEQGASAGNVGNDIINAQKKANPTALLLSAAMMLRHLQFPSFADRLEHAIYGVIAEGLVRPPAMGGDSTTQEYYDLSVTTYSPDGRIFQIEYAGKAVDNSGTAVGLRCKDGVVMGVEKLLVSKMQVQGSNRRIHIVDKHAGIAVAGLVADGRQVVNRARNEAVNYKSFFAHMIPLKVLADRMASYAHYFTLYWWTRPLGSSVLLAGYDRDGPQLYCIEPSGVTYRYHGTAVGKGRQAAKTEIEKLKLSEMTCREGVNAVAKIIVGVHDEAKDKAFELEMGWCCEDSNRQFQRVPDDIVKAARDAAEAAMDEDMDD
ncbi:unnamed protein product [Closterium sp. Naga37s-1]|nr:unnamed protein product [Closterium sp. Naga37s-1]